MEREYNALSNGIKIASKYKLFSKLFSFKVRDSLLLGYAVYFVNAHIQLSVAVIIAAHNFFERILYH